MWGRLRPCNPSVRRCTVELRDPAGSLVLLSNAHARVCALVWGARALFMLGGVGSEIVVVAGLCTAVRACTSLGLDFICISQAGHKRACEKAWYAVVLRPPQWSLWPLVLLDLMKRMNWLCVDCFITLCCEVPACGAFSTGCASNVCFRCRSIFKIIPTADPWIAMTVAIATGQLAGATFF